MKFLYPVQPNSIITQTFAEHERRRETNGWTQYNGAIDWGIPTGTRIKAAQSGIVTVVRSDATGYGTHVRIEHTEGNVKFLSIYAHLMNVNVAVGATVNAGDIVGKSDNTGFSSGPHLHFEIRKGTQPIDPAPLLVRTVAELGSTRAPVIEEEVIVDEGTEPQPFPIPPKARIVAVMLNIRSGPGLENRITGTLISGAEVGVLRKIRQGNDIWLQIGHEQYIALRYEGNILATWI
jgi:hypothetical protein